MEQVTFFGPPITTKPEMSAEKLMVHCRLAGCTPPLTAIDKASGTAEPGVPLPEASEMETDCAVAGELDQAKKTREKHMVISAVWSRGC